MKSMNLRITMMTLCLSATVVLAQGTQKSISQVLMEYEAAFTDPAFSETEEACAHWRDRLVAQRLQLQPEVTAQTKSQLDGSLVALHSSLRDWGAARALSLECLTSASGCGERGRWANYALAALVGEAVAERRQVDPDAAADIARQGLQPCGALSGLNDVDLTYAIVLAHVVASTEADLATRFARLETLEREAADLDGARGQLDLSTDRFNIALNAARAALSLGDAAGASGMLDRMQSYGERGCEYAGVAANTLMADRSIPLEVRSAFLTDRCAGGVDAAEVSLMAWFAHEISPFSDRRMDRAVLALGWIEAALSAENAAVLAQADEDAAAIQQRLILVTEPPNPPSVTDAAPVTASLLEHRWQILRHVIKDRAASGVAAAAILERFPGHDLRLDIERDAAKR